MSGDASHPERTGEQNVGTVATENPAGGRPGERHEVGNAASSQRDRPHLTENDQANEDEAPALPANASGHDRVSSEDQDFEVEEGSAYDRRPSQDKDRPPSKE